MAASLRSALRETGTDAAVEVNQRALIDKVLARYSGELIPFRELLQNADDASAEVVQIVFHSKNEQAVTDALCEGNSRSTFDLAAHVTTGFTVRNDGQVFNEADWARIRKIAEGNPDEQKIGAFGVGAYSLFSLCEEPIISSGPQAVLFHWGKANGDQLYVKQGANPNAQTDFSPEGKAWTTFEITLREEGPAPDMMQFCQFLANSLAFTSNLRHIQVFLDSFCLCDLSKKLAPPLPIAPSSSLLLTTPKRLMAIQSVQYANFQLDARVLGIVMRSEEIKKQAKAAPRVLSTATKFFQTAFSLAVSQPVAQNTESTGQLVSLGQVHTSSIFLRIANATVNVSLSNRQLNELERATKKRPPSRTTFQIIYSSKDEYDASQPSTGERTSVMAVFSGLVCSPEKQGRLAIGFMTHQTSGCAASIAGRFIPTVERESLDLQNGEVANWNTELLAVGGILARVIYEDEMGAIGRQWDKADVEQKQKLVDNFAHLARFFSYQPSTPAPLVAEACEAAFFSTAKRSEISVLTTVGVVSSQKARLPNAELESFLKTLATVHSTVTDAAPIFVSQLHQRGLLKELSMPDVLQELGNRPLSIDEMRACLTWCARLTTNQQYTPDMTAKLLNAAILEVSSDDILALYTVKRFLGQRSLLHDLQTPPGTVPYKLSQHLKHSDMTKIFGWSETPVSEELNYLLSPTFTGPKASTETNMLVNAHFSEKIIVTIAKNWGTFSSPARNSVATILRENAVIPTKKSLQKAPESYFENVSLFDDLCIIAFKEPVRGNLEKVLSFAGVQKHVDLQTIFTRLFTAGNWSHYDLIKYLVSVQSTLSDDEYRRLRRTAWLPQEGLDAVGVEVKSRFTADALLEPLPTFRALKLPVIDWPVKWFGSSPEAKLLMKIGLRRHPNVNTLLKAASDPDDAERRRQALNFYLNNYESNGYHRWQNGDESIAFIPSQRSDGAAMLSTPANCFADRGAAELGFTTLNASLLLEAKKLRVESAPPAASLVSALLNNPPKTLTKANTVFTYLSARLADFKPEHWKAFRQSDIIPIFRANGELSKTTKPTACYFAKANAQTSALFSSIFTFVDFGPSAKPFLAASGVQEEPTSAEVARLLVNDPSHLLTLAGTPENYLDLLRIIATSYRQMPASLLKAMRNSPIILTSIRIPSKQKTSKEEQLIDFDDEEDDTEPLLRHALKTPGESVVIDDVNLWRLFGSVVYSVPQEDALEAFAEELGASRISNLVKDTHRVSGQQPQNARMDELSKLIVERAALFLHERQQQSTNEVRRSAEWLKKNLRVVEVSKLEIHRAITLSGQRHLKVLPSTAIASQEGTQLVLYILRTEEPDWFEVASTLMKHILARQRINDALLFMTLLSTTLKTLQRRGFDTSRILSARKKELQLAQQRQQEFELQRDLEKSKETRQQQVADDTAKLRDMFPDADKKHLDSLIKGNDADELQRAAEKMMSGSYPRQETAPSGLTPEKGRTSNMFGNFRKKLGYNKPENPLLPPEKGLVNNTANESRSSAPVVQPPPAGIPPADSRVTPMNDIRENCLRAVQASRPDRSSAIQNDSDLRQVKESQASYCDPTSAADLVFVTEIEQLRFYVAQKVDSSLILTQHGDALRRFATKIIHPVGKVFRLDPRALHLFYDVSGPLIAFNRNGSLFLNLRFYIQWHDKEVAANNLDNALISWYFSLAHELAHNLVATHDAQHEFYTSSLAEMAFIGLAKQLSAVHL